MSRPTVHSFRRPAIGDTIGCRPGSRRCFTLVELMVAMSILSLLMLLLFQFLISIQKNWALSEGTSRIYENASIVFDLLENDFRTMTVSGITNEKIGYYVGNPNPDNPSQALIACIVSVNDPIEDGAKSHLVEVSYKHHTSASDPAHRYQLRRQVVSDVDAGANWDFYGEPPGWYDNDHASSTRPNYEEVINGVAEFQLLFYDSHGNQIAPNTDTCVMPSQVVVNLVLFDETLQNAPASVRFRTMRAFTKIFSLNEIE